MVEHRVQMIADQQTHVLPANAEALTQVALLHGWNSSDDLLEWLRPYVVRIGEAFDELAGDDSRNLPADHEGLERELRKLGFADHNRFTMRANRMRHDA